MSDKKIDIPKPGGSFLKPQDMKLLIGFISLMAVVVAGAWAYSSFFKEKKQKEEVNLMIQAGIDPAYLTYTPDAEGVGGKEDKKSYFTLELDEEEEGQAEKPEIRVGAQPPPQPKPRPGAKDLFVFEKGPKIDPKILLAQKINAARAGSLQVQVSITPAERAAYVKAQEPKIEFENTQEDFKKQEGKIVASFPVDLSRVLTADRRITAVLENDLASELGGKVTATVMSNVYAAKGDKILIPAGSRVIAYYKPLDKIGQERLELKVPRIITPQGINIHLGEGEISDAMGRSGVTGELDRRYLERYGMAFAVSLVNAAALYNVKVENANQQLVVENTGREISQLSKTILDDHIQIKPRVNIPHGSIIHISAPMDIWFKEPVRNEIYTSTKNSEGEWK